MRLSPVPPFVAALAKKGRRSRFSEGKEGTHDGGEDGRVEEASYCRDNMKSKLTLSSVVIQKG
jgi:hypothetical protein